MRVLDISYNGLGDPGDFVVGEALKTNNVLEELDMRRGALHTPCVIVSGLIATPGTRGSMILLLFTTLIPKTTTVYP